MCARQTGHVHRMDGPNADVDVPHTKSLRLLVLLLVKLRFSKAWSPSATILKGSLTATILTIRAKYELALPFEWKPPVAKLCEIIDAHVVRSDFEWGIPSWPRLLWNSRWLPNQFEKALPYFLKQQMRTRVNPVILGSSCHILFSADSPKISANTSQPPNRFKKQNITNNFDWVIPSKFEHEISFLEPPMKIYTKGLGANNHLAEADISKTHCGAPIVQISETEGLLITVLSVRKGFNKQWSWPNQPCCLKSQSLPSSRSNDGRSSPASMQSSFLFALNSATPLGITFIQVNGATNYIHNRIQSNIHTIQFIHFILCWQPKVCMLACCCSKHQFAWRWCSHWVLKHWWPKFFCLACTSGAYEPTF